MQTLEREKINDRFEFPLELDLKDYLDEDHIESADSTQYELKSIIIHSGGCYGGHYIAYIKDDLKEGEWYLDWPEKFAEQPEALEKKVFDPTKYMTEE